MSNAPLFTVFTPTYNRAHTLHRVFDSLCAQTLRDFEWLVVDDGSTDNTAELIHQWSRQADFPIRYFKKQHNSGKHIAHNLAVREAAGSIFAPLDSDDALVPDALERIYGVWNSIPPSERAGYSGIGGLCCDQCGVIIGDRFPTSPFDSNLRELVYAYRIRGEKWGVTLTEVFRQYPYPEIAGTQYVPEGLVGLQMSRVFRRRYVNEVFRIYFVGEEHAQGVNLSNRANLSTTAPGRLYYYLWLLNHEIDFFRRSPIPFLKAALMLPLATWWSGGSVLSTLSELRDYRAKTLVCAVLPASILYYFLYSRRIAFHQ